MKKLLFQLDTDPAPASFDVVVAYDSGVDHVIPYAAMTPEKAGSLVEGVIFTRAPNQKRYTALFIGGSDVAAGQELLAAIRGKFFGRFRVSAMLDSNGCNTTAAAAVANLANGRLLRGKKAVVLAGTGPVGQRAALMLAKEGAEVTITSRHLDKAEQACGELEQLAGLPFHACEARDSASRAQAITSAQIVLACGASGISLLNSDDWQQHATIELLLDANATPPQGIGGIDVKDRGTIRFGKMTWGALGFGPLKLKLQRACIARLFEQNDLILDADEIYSTAKQMASAGMSDHV